MIARVLDIPDDPAEMPAWLDRQIAGADLHEIVAELAAVHGAAPGGGSAEADEVSRWLGPSLPAVLARGTAALEGRRVGELLRTPRLLPGLQELVFVEGGEYWQDLAASAASAAGLPSLDVAQLVANGRRPAADDRFGRRNTAEPRREPLATANRVPTLGQTPPAPLQRLKNNVAPFLAALAASLLVGVGIWAWRGSEPAATAWGWNRAEALAAATPDAYLERLAAGAAEWSAVPPSTESALAARLREMLTGCDRLIAAPHEPLDATDREWLVEKCRTWREKLAGHLVALAESHDVATVGREADATVQKLTAALRARAEEVRQRRVSEGTLAPGRGLDHGSPARSRGGKNAYSPLHHDHGLEQPAGARELLLLVRGRSGP